MRVFDTSSIIHGWDNYPVKQFPPLWDWLSDQIDKEEIVVPKVALIEVSHISPDCHKWLTANQLHVVDVSNDIANEATRIKHLLGVFNDNYHPKGVDESDIIIIATAKILDVELVSDEGRQAKRPDVPHKRKIPSVCDIKTVDVDCIDFVEYFKGSDQVFK